MTGHDRIRPATLDDADAIAGLVSMLGYPTTPAAMRARLETLLANADHVTLVAEAAGRVVGVTAGVLGRYYEMDGVYARIVLLAVAPESRRRGLGGALVTGVESWAHGRGARNVLVNTAHHRAEAHAFYEARGFRNTGYRFVKSAPPESA